jgi:asparagine synthase (glutamine-hydrolysing)
MCGIAGIHYFGNIEQKPGTEKEKIFSLMRHRGPDNEGFAKFFNTYLYHTRLSIIDNSAASNQPFADDDKLFSLVYNGEIFNYRELQKDLKSLTTSGDTEVLFKILKSGDKRDLNKLNGFFSFAFYDVTAKSLFLARDRYGVKPLYYYKSDSFFAFASELKPLLQLTGPQEINQNQLYAYFRLNYCAGEETIFKNVYRLLPGQCISVTNNNIKVDTWYKATRSIVKEDFESLLEDAVKIRLNADVPVGTFLSGGLDSSIISALAIRHKSDLNTFSIGFKNHNYFDETIYAEKVARHIGSNHHVFKLTEDDFLHNIYPFLNCIDEPFGDSSAFNLYMLSLYTGRHVKVALSGDGADELFKGYFKHKALKLSESARTRFLSNVLGAVFSKSRSSRDGAINNRIRQIKRFETLIRLPEVEKQKFLASVSDHSECATLLRAGISSFYFDSLFKSNESFKEFGIENTFDLQTVLADDMLVKTDRFSMQHGLEVRTPFLDYRVVEFALNMSISKKINSTNQKIILKETFAHLLPKEVLKRRKKGFELPLNAWLTGALSTQIENEWLNENKLISENILSVPQIQKIKRKLKSNDPGDSASQLWAIIVFEKWLENFKNHIKSSD